MIAAGAVSIPTDTPGQPDESTAAGIKGYTTSLTICPAHGAPVMQDTDLPDRLTGVLAVVYLGFTQGYVA